MKRTQSLILLAIYLLSGSAAANPDEASAPKTSAVPSSNQPVGGVLVSAPASAATVPKNFMSYASEPTDFGKIFIVGAVTNDNGMNQRPAVYAADAQDKHIVWFDELAVAAHSFQSRATHCSFSSDSFFVLLQGDTQANQTRSQTQLQVVKISARTGEVLARQSVVVPDAYTAWVDEGSANFHLENGMLSISGNFRATSNEDSPKPFTIRLTRDLQPFNVGKS